MFKRNNDENNTQIAPNADTSQWPPNAPMVFQTTTMVSTPNKAGKTAPKRHQNRDT
jgi:hypothetical protein